MKTFRKAQGMQVATIAEGALLGKLEDFQFDLETGRIYGYRLKGPGVFGRGGGIPADATTLIGRDLVLVKTETAVEWAGERRNAEDGRAWAVTYRKTRVISRRGASLGIVEDFILDGAPPRVIALLLDNQRMARLDRRVTLGRDAVILEDPAAAVAIESEEEETTDWWTRVRGTFSGDEKKE